MIRKAWTIFLCGALWGAALVRPALGQYTSLDGTYRYAPDVPAPTSPRQPLPQRGAPRWDVSGTPAPPVYSLVLTGNSYRASHSYTVAEPIYQTVQTATQSGYQYSRQQVGVRYVTKTRMGAGTFVREGNVLTFNGGGEFVLRVGTIDGSTITVNGNLVFEK